MRHSHHLCWWEEARPFWPIVLASPVGFLIHPFYRKRKQKVYFHFVHIFLCAVPILFFPPKVIVILKHAALVEIYQKIISASTPTMGLEKLGPPWSFLSITSRQGIRMRTGRAEKGVMEQRAAPSEKEPLLFVSSSLYYES